MEFGLMHIWQTMGVTAKLVALVLLIMSVYLVGLSIERYLHFGRSRRANDNFVRAMRELLEKKRHASTLAEVRALAKSSRPAPVIRVADAAAAAYERQEKGEIGALDLVVGINRAVERTIERETSGLKRGMGFLATIASVAPFVGLFGTVVGIINAFQSMALTGSGGLAAVSAGISEALVATAFGLLVAIPAVGIYNHMTGIVDGFVVDMDEVSSELVEAVLLSRR